MKKRQVETLRAEPAGHATAYLVGFLDVRASPPVVVKVAIMATPASFGQGPESHGAPIMPFDITSFTSDSYERSASKLLSYVKGENPVIGDHWSWAVPLLGEPSMVS